MPTNDITTYVSAGSFLTVTGALIRLFWKFNKNAEGIYARRSADQVATIADLETHAKESRQELDNCHEERRQLSEKVAKQEVHIIRLEGKVSGLEDQMAKLVHSKKRL